MVVEQRIKDMCEVEYRRVGMVKQVDRRICSRGFTETLVAVLECRLRFRHDGICGDVVESADTAET